MRRMEIESMNKTDPTPELQNESVASSMCSEAQTSDTVEKGRDCGQVPGCDGGR